MRTSDNGKRLFVKKVRALRSNLFISMSNFGICDNNLHISYITPPNYQVNLINATVLDNLSNLNPLQFTNNTTQQSNPSYFNFATNNSIGNPQCVVNDLIAYPLLLNNHVSNNPSSGQLHFELQMPYQIV